MRNKVIALSQSYALALREHLKEGPQASLQRARGLGRRAVAMGLGTLDLAKIHEGALATLEASGCRNGIAGRAECFFTEAIAPIEKTHGVALRTNIRLNQLSKDLGLRSMALTAANRSLKQGIARRKAVERVLRKSNGHLKKLLAESRRLQKHLRHLAHRIISAQENKRKKVSHTLQDGIGQTLLGINVRLLTLKNEATVNAKGFKKDVASTQRLVEESIRSIHRVRA